MTLDLRSRELEHSFIKDRICNVEKHLYDIGLKLSNYNKKLAHLRDSGDDFAKSVLRFASKENLNQSLRISLSEYSDIFAALQDYRDVQVQRIDAKVVPVLGNYSSVCKKAKEELKRSFDAHTVEFKKQTQLEKMREKNSTNWQKISQAEKEANLARDEATHASLEMSRRIDCFEKKKLEDIKNTLLEFIRIEMIFHTKAIELHTNAYNVVKNINTEEDLHEFRCHFKAHTANLDTQCLSNIDTVKKSVEEADTSNSHSKSSPVNNKDNEFKHIFTLKDDHLKLEYSNSSHKNLSESKLDLKDHPIQ